MESEGLLNRLEGFITDSAVRSQESGDLEAELVALRLLADLRRAVMLDAAPFRGRRRYEVEVFEAVSGRKSGDVGCRIKSETSDLILGGQKAKMMGYMAKRQNQLVSRAEMLKELYGARPIRRDSFQDAWEELRDRVNGHFNEQVLITGSVSDSAVGKSGRSSGGFIFINPIR